MRIATLLPRTALGVVLLFASSAAHAAARGKARAPAWLAELATVPTPAFAESEKAVCLLDDATSKVAPDGKIVTSVRRAVRVQSPDGRDWAAAYALYNADYQKIVAFDAWLVGADGTVRAYTRKEASDLALGMSDVYSNVRMLSLSLAAEAQAGALFGCAWTTEEKSIFAQEVWSFQQTIPVALSRITYDLPPGWRADGVALRGALPERETFANRVSWSARELPPIPDEPWGPPRGELARAMAINLVPADAVASRLPWARFATWQDVSRYLAGVHDARATPDAAITAKAQQLTAGNASHGERIAAIGRFVQGVNYASIQLGTGKGGGYTPNPAAQVLKRNYGDCKDKTILMRALLRAVGVHSYSTFAFAQERRSVVEAWPSPQQFDHCIIAVEADESVTGPAVITHPELGRLLVFDPTSPSTPVGELTWVQQGSRVLIGAGTAHDLVALPYPGAGGNKLERRLEASLDAAGTISAVLDERSWGVTAAGERSLLREASAAEYSRTIANWIGRSARSATVSSVAPRDAMLDAGGFELRVEFAAKNFAQSMGGQLLVFKPAAVPPRTHVALTERKRSTPVRLTPSDYDERITIRLPAGFAVDELPPPVKIARQFARFELTSEVRDGVLQVRRVRSLDAAEIPPDRYEEVRSFFEAINRAEQTPVVLKRQ